MIRPMVDPPVLLVATLVLLGVVVWGIAWSTRTELTGWLRRGLMVLLVAAIALRPGFGEMPTTTRPSDLEVLVMVDRTTSMSARDWNGKRPRLQGVKRDVTRLVGALPSSRFTIVTFGKTVRTKLPSTSDVTLIREALDQINREEAFDGIGSRIDRPLGKMQQTLTRMREQHPDRRTILVLLTDGENTQPGPLRSFATLKPLLDDGVTLGYGTAAGGRMPKAVAHPERGWVEDSDTGEPARSLIDEENLQTVAREMGIGYIHRESPGGLQDVAAAWEQKFSEQSDANDEDVPAQLELAWILALALLLVALLDLRQHWRRLWQARRELA